MLVVDGGSTDRTVELAAPRCDRVLSAPRGRAAQMNAGAAAARGRLLWFVHADSLVDPRLRPRLLGCVAWGRCDVRIDDPAWVFRVIERAMNWRSRLSAIATGDQGLCVARTLFETVGGFPSLALMEDIELSARLRRHARPVRFTPALGTSARRWRTRGIARTIVLMWTLRLAWFCGVPAVRLARWYR